MMPISKKLVCLVMLFAAPSLGVAKGAPARFWVSPSATEPFSSGLNTSDTLEIDLMSDPLDGANSQAILYIWAQPETSATSSGFKQLRNMTLDVVSTSPLIDFIDDKALMQRTPNRFSQYRDGDELFEGNPDLQLMTKTPSQIRGEDPETPCVGNACSDKIEGLQGLNLTVPVEIQDVGIGPDCLADCMDPTGENPAWLVASFGVQSINEIGVVDIHLQIGNGGMNHLSDSGNTIEPTAMTKVVFSATGQAPIYNAGSNDGGQCAAGTAGDRQCTFAGDAPEVRIHISNSLTGDYQEDGAVNGADFLTWQRVLGSTALPNRRAGLSGPDDTIDQRDLHAWGANFGKSLSPPSSVVRVPEPRSGFLLLATTLALAFCRRNKSCFAALSVGFALLHLMMPNPCLAQGTLPGTLFWDGASGDVWGNPGNWRIDNGGTRPYSGGDPGSGSDVDRYRNFAFNASGFPTVSASVSLFGPSSENTGLQRVLDSIVFNGNSGGGVTINSGGPNATANTLTFSEGSGNEDLRITPMAGNVTINAPIVISRVNDWLHNGTSDFQVNGPIFLGSSLSIESRNTGDTRLSGAISGASSITKTESGMLTFSGNFTHTFTGGVNLQGGTTRLFSRPGSSSVANIGTGPLTVSNSTIRAAEHLILPGMTLNGGGVDFQHQGFNIFVQGSVTGIGAITKFGDGILTLAGQNSYSGGTIINNGTVAIGRSDALAPIGHVEIGDATFDVNGHSPTIGSLAGVAASNVTLDGGNLTVGQNNGDTTFGGVISGSGGSITKIGTGTLTLSGDNTYTGATVIDGGRLELGNNSRISDASDVTVSAFATFDLNNFAEAIDGLSGSGSVELGDLSSGRLIVGDNDGTSIFSGDIGGTGRLDKRGSGTFTLSGANTYAGPTVITGGTLRIGSSNRIPNASDITVAGTTSFFDINGFSETIDGLSGDGNITLGSGALGIGANNGSSIFDGTISGIGGAIQKLGSGTLTLNGINDYSGGTFIDGGTVVGTTDSIRGPVNVAAGAQVVFDALAGPKSFLRTPVAGEGILVKRGEGTLVLNTPNTFTMAETIIEAGDVEVGAENLSSNIEIMEGATLRLFGDTGNPNIQVLDGNLTGEGALSIDARTSTISLVGSNSVTGGTSIVGGTVVGSTASIAGPVSLSGGTTLVFDQPVDGFTTGPITGSGTVIKRGTGRLVLNTPFSYSPDEIAIEEGRVSVVAGALATDVAISAGASLDLQASALDQNQTYSHTISGQGELLKTGADVVTINGTQQYTGLTTVSSGTLRINGSISGSATVLTGATLGGNGTIGGDVSGPGRVAPGNSPGILTINGDYTQSADSVLEIEVGGLTPGPGTPDVDDGHDQVRVGGTVTLGGRYDFPIINNFVPTAGDEIVFIDTFGTGMITPGTRPKMAFAPGLEAANPDLAFRVTSDTVLDQVRLKFVDKNEIFFDEVTAGATYQWFDETRWTDPAAPMVDRDPDDLDITTVGNLSSGPQTVVVDTLDPNTSKNAEVARLFVGDESQPITIKLETGFGLSSTVGDITVGDRGAIEVAAGSTLSAPHSQVVMVTSGGVLSGDGLVNLRSANLEQAGSVEVMGGTLSPSLSAANAAVGTLDIDGSYTQGSGGVYAVDITGDNLGGNHDFVDISGTANLGGTLMIDASSFAGLATGEMYEILSADAGLVDQFEDVVVTGAGSRYFKVIYEDGAGASQTANGELAALSGGGASRVLVAPFDMGDASGDGAIDSVDAQAFAGAIFDLSQTFDFGGGLTADPIDLRSAFDFSGDRKIDLDDVSEFANMFATVNGVSLASAYQSLEAAFAQFHAGPAVPEPTTLSLCLMVTLIVSGGHRNGRMTR